MSDSSAYDHFFEVMEEFNFPKSQSSNNFVEERISMKRSRKEMGMVETFFKAVEHASFPQLKSSDALSSFSSNNSLGDFASTNSIDDVGKPHHVFQAMQKLIVTNSSSSASLCDKENFQQFEENRPSIFSKFVPNAVVRFVEVYDEFMQNNPH
jgi:hypothetical protein